ncbi:DeoR/GlpR family DNA-binding transcription regulator [Ligilactobacillus equi]|uniref:DeoR/GlpR family DNA-binding transcription regulator n=1 Tax=Ligilactobacillus equi TaxID=137357 RepID=UPI002ED5E7F6
MNIEERHKIILDKLSTYGNVKITDLSKELDISRETVRKDIYNLEKQQKLIAIRGGATSLSSGISETKYGQRLQQNTMEKKYIADRALNLIHNSNTIFLDYGTSVVELAKKIEQSELHDLTIITTSLNVALIFQYTTRHQLICLGGGLRPEEGSFSGPLTLNNIDSLYCDLGFFGCGGISLNAGLTNHYFSEVEVSKKMMQHSRQKIVLAPHDKFSKEALYVTAPLSEISHIITDNQTPTEIIKSFNNKRQLVLN